MRKPSGPKEAYKRLSNAHRASVCSYRANKGIFSEPQFKRGFQTCVKHISYFRVGSHHQNIIVEHRINELALDSWTLLLNSNIL